MSNWHYTGVKLNANELASLKEQLNQPYIVLGGHVPESNEEIIHRTALEKGLPDIHGYYGCTSDGEFICLPEAVGTTPDAFPSRKLDDIIAGEKL